jgi:hypothetical protein
LGFGQVFGDEVDTIGIPTTFDVQAMGVAATAAIANTFGGGGVLKRRGEHAKSLLFLLVTTLFSRARTERE